ncbi:uncharacterized protein [Drosophila tropicalis]|uniref:uncharacterized protein n=1 Tax=Drosophila tropicalis TaxID=46794 RepID=UPI0035ABB420
MLASAVPTTAIQAPAGLTDATSAPAGPTAATLAPAGPTADMHSYEELKAILLREFGRSCSIEEVYHALRGRRIKAGEGCLRFAIEMQEIAMNAPIPENELVDLIIDGLRDNSTRVGMLYSARTMAELKPLLERYERFRMPAAASRQGNSVKARPTTTPVAPGSKSSGTATMPQLLRMGALQKSMPKTNETSEFMF